MKKKDKEITFLGKETAFEGRLTFQGTIRIDGHVKGEISSTGTLIIGEEATIEADIHVSYIIISGEIHGNIVADQRVDIHAPGKVFGNIMAPNVVIEEGVIFEGQTKMYHARESEAGQPTVIGANEYAGGPPPTLTAIYGIVTDQQSAKPLKNANVKCKGLESKSIRTNASGYYELINLKQGKWSLKVEAKGYKSGKAKLEIEDNGTHKQNFELAPKKKN
ncbi:polymer-forming cytoskeletal protein [Thermodesulfobacteriota bacterium]